MQHNVECNGKKNCGLLQLFIVYDFPQQVMIVAVTTGIVYTPPCQNGLIKVKDSAFCGEIEPGLNMDWPGLNKLIMCTCASGSNKWTQTSGINTWQILTVQHQRPKTTILALENNKTTRMHFMEMGKCTAHRWILNRTSLCCVNQFSSIWTHIFTSC